MPSKTISVTNGDGSTRTITIPDRSRFAGVRNISRAVNELPLTDSTTSIQVTVAGHSDLDGVYTTSGVGTAAIWLQQGGNGRIESGGYNSEGDYTDWYFLDVGDGDPTVTYYGTQSDDRPWKPANTGIVTITGVAGTETLTVNRTAPVITSDRKGESRPLLSKLVGGAAAAYSLRDLNDKAGNNKVVEVRRSSDDADRIFLAKEVSNGTLEAWVNEDYAKYTSDFSAGENGWGSLDDVTETGNIDGIGGLDSNLRLAIGSGTGTHRGFKTAIFPVNQKINFSARVFIPSTNSVVDSFRITDASGIGVIASTTPAQDQWVTVTASNVTTINTAGQLRIFLQDGGLNNFTGNGSDVIYLREVTVTQVTSDGFVSKWYDQSGENFHMLQAESTKQPKIVEAGTFLDSVKYDGVDDFLTSGSTAETMLDVHNQALSLFSVQTRVTANDSTLGATNSGRGISFESTVTRVFITQTLHLVNHSADGSGFLLGSVIHTGDGSSDQIKTARNGVNIEEVSQGSNDITSDAQPIFTTKYNTLGGNRVLTTNSNFFNGEIKEVVIWKTNQLANRLAIEANINNQYDIY